MTKKKAEVAAFKLSDSLGELHRMISIVEDSMEKGEDIPTSIIPAMELSVENFRSAVDKRINSIEKLSWFIDYVSAQTKIMKDKEKTLKNILTKVKEDTKYHVENNPELDWKGSIKKIYLQENGTVPRKWHIDLGKVDNVVELDDLEKVPEGYYREEKVFVLDKERVVRDVEWNEELQKVCTLGERGKNLRIR